MALWYGIFGGESAAQPVLVTAFRHGTRRYGRIYRSVKVTGWQSWVVVRCKKCVSHLCIFSFANPAANCAIVRIWNMRALGRCDRSWFERYLQRENRDRDRPDLQPIIAVTFGLRLEYAVLCLRRWLGAGRFRNATTNWIPCSLLTKTHRSTYFTQTGCSSSAGDEGSARLGLAYQPETGGLQSHLQSNESWLCIQSGVGSLHRLSCCNHLRRDRLTGVATRQATGIITVNRLEKCRHIPRDMLQQTWQRYGGRTAKCTKDHCPAFKRSSLSFQLPAVATAVTIVKTMWTT